MSDTFAAEEPVQHGRSHRQPVPSANAQQHREQINLLAARRRAAAERQRSAQQGQAPNQPQIPSTPRRQVQQPVQQPQVPFAPRGQPQQDQLPEVNVAQDDYDPHSPHSPMTSFMANSDFGQYQNLNITASATASSSMPSFSTSSTSLPSLVTSSSVSPSFEGLIPFGDSEFSDLTPEERAEMAADPDANESRESLYSDARLSTLGQDLDIQMTTQPVSLPGPKRLVRRAPNSAIAATPFTNRAAEPGPSSQRLIHRSHVTPPTPSGNKENVSASAASSQALGKRKASALSDQYTPLDTEQDDGDSVDNADVSAGRNGKPGLRASDLAPSRRRILILALTKYRMVDHLEHSDYIGNAPPTDDELELIKIRTTQMRGDMIRCARALVSPFFELKPAANAEKLNETRETVAALLKNDNFVRKDPFRNHNVPGSLFRSTLIQHIINHTAFNDSARSEGLHGDSFAEKITLPAIALVATAIQCAIEEWKTGSKVQIPFTAKVYEKSYTRHLKQLQRWEAYSSAPGKSMATIILQQDLLEAAKIHAGVFGRYEPTEMIRGLSDDNFAAEEGLAVTPEVAQ
ncbi:hypothetical protein C8J56DRAFT_1100511 [Mycena floridula]|nr:hypothetical protein C8J56DRAFT_1100511 [Mycena floridula]